jgi:hypothetical protein
LLHSPRFLTPCRRYINVLLPDLTKAASPITKTSRAITLMPCRHCSRCMTSSPLPPPAASLLRGSYLLPISLMLETISMYLLPHPTQSPWSLSFSKLPSCMIPCLAYAGPFPCLFDSKAWLGEWLAHTALLPCYFLGSSILVLLKGNGLLRSEICVTSTR